MFQFPGSRFSQSLQLWIYICDVGVPPFGYRRIGACLLLPVAFRRLLRPSSPDSA